MKAAATMLVAGGLLALPGASVAEAVTYKGKTSGGSTITLKRSGNSIRSIRTVVPTICTETTGSGLSRAGAELFRPPGRTTLGRTRKVKALQPAALNNGSKATKNYTLRVTRSGRRVKGKLRLSYSFLRLDLFRSMPYVYICSGSATFVARPR
jgi:hypothetical protein